MKRQPTGEDIHRAVYDYARTRTQEWLAMAVERDIITARQGVALMAVWDETHPYEALDQ